MLNSLALRDGMRFNQHGIDEGDPHLFADAVRDAFDPHQVK